MMQEMMSRAARVAILADSSKFGRRLFAQVSELSGADYLVTDAMPPPGLRDALAENNVELITPAALSRQREAKTRSSRRPSRRPVRRARSGSPRPVGGR
jgi:DeoR family glycerol-3-phosphate regulon repressor/DeoR family fructose operon transcriptional repressor